MILCSWVLILDRMWILGVKVNYGLYVMVMKVYKLLGRIGELNYGCFG